MTRQDRGQGRTCGPCRASPCKQQATASLQCDPCGASKTVTTRFLLVSRHCWPTMCPGCWTLSPRDVCSCRGILVGEGDAPRRHIGPFGQTPSCARMAAHTSEVEFLRCLAASNALTTRLRPWATVHQAASYRWAGLLAVAAPLALAWPHVDMADEFDGCFW